MKGEQIPVKILSLRMIANVSPALRSALGLNVRHRALGLISADSDDATYLALDEATKAANVDVVYARSLYAGAANATTRLAGEVIGILGGENPSDILSALRGKLRQLSRLRRTRSRRTGAGLPDRAAGRGRAGAGRGIKGLGCGACGIFRTAERDEFCRCAAHGHAVGVQGSLRRLCRGGLRRRRETDRIGRMELWSLTATFSRVSRRAA